MNGMNEIDEKHLLVWVILTSILLVLMRLVVLYWSVMSGLNDVTGWSPMWEGKAQNETTPADGWSQLTLIFHVQKKTGMSLCLHTSSHCCSPGSSFQEPLWSHHSHTAVDNLAPQCWGSLHCPALFYSSLSFFPLVRGRFTPPSPPSSPFCLTSLHPDKQEIAHKR